MSVEFKNGSNARFSEISDNTQKNIEPSNGALTSTTSLIESVVVCKFPQHVRCWPHPGITTNLRTREEFQRLNTEGNILLNTMMTNGLSRSEAGSMVFKKLFGNLFSSTEEGDPRDSAFGMDRITYEEACDFVEKTWIPISSHTPATFSSMLQKIHEHIIAPDHPNLKGVPPGQYRPAISGSEMLVFKNEAIRKLQNVPAYIDHKITLLSSDPDVKSKKKELKKIKKEIQKIALTRHSYYEIITQKLISPKAIELLNEIFVIFPPNTDVEPLMKKMIELVLKKIQAKEESCIEKTCARRALSIDEWLASNNTDLFGLQLSKMSKQDLQKHFPEDAISIAAFAHLELVRIHPFSEANGRMARMLMNVILMQGGHEPIGFVYDKPYTAAIRAEDAGCVGAFQRFLRENIHEMTPVPIYELQKHKTITLLSPPSLL